MGRYLSRHALAIFYTALAAALASCTLYIYHTAPILYAQLVTEHLPGEYATMVAFGGAGLLLIVLSFRPGPATRRIVWKVMGVAAIVVAGEETSWGESIFDHLFGVTLPSAVRDINLQNEFNLHNLEAIGLSSGAYRAGASLVIVLVVVSALVSIFRPQWAESLLDGGAPLVPLRLSALFLLAPLLYLPRLVGKPSEILELLMGVAALLWVLDRYHHLGGQIGDTKLGGDARAVWVAAGSILLVAMTATTLSLFTPPGPLAQRLNSLAARDYPNHGLYRQAEAIYEHIYANPVYLMPETRFNHAAMLQSIGEDTKAAQILAVATKELEDANRGGSDDSDRWRLLGSAYRFAGQDEKAEAAFARAIEVDELRLHQVSSPDEKGMLLWSLAMTLATRGDRTAALAAAQQALTQATSASVRRQITTWIEATPEAQ